MKRLGFALGILTALAILAVGCKPSYSLTVHVTDSNGNTIPRAQVALTDLGKTQTVNDTGQAVWQDLAADATTMIVAAEGYTSKTIQVMLRPGENQVTISLDPKAEDFAPPSS